PSSVMNCRRLTSSMGSPSEPAMAAYRTLSLPWKHPQVLGVGLNRSERRPPSGQNVRAARFVLRSLEMNSSRNVHPQDHDKEKQCGIQRHRVGIRNPAVRLIALVHGAPLSSYS